MRARESTLLQMAAIASTFLLGACGAPVEGTASSSTGAGPTDPIVVSPASSPTALAAACTEYHAAHRAWFQRCEGHDLGQSTVDALTQRCATHAVLPGMTLSAERLTECAASFGAATCGYLPPECLTGEGIFHSRRTWSVRTIPLGGVGPYYDYVLFPRSKGASPAGSPCDFFDQCKSGVCSSSYSQCGVCMQIVTAGEACSPSTICASGHCLAGVCVPDTPTVGQACHFEGKGGERSNCQRKDYCNSNASGPDEGGVCQARLSPGDACVDLGFSSENPCIDGALCRVGHCVAIMVAKEGQSCDGDVVVCEEGIQCDQSTCRKPRTDVPEGGDCAVNRCAPPLFCGASFTCAPRRELGAACEPNRLCSPDSMCSAEGVCGAMPGEGAQCNPGFELCAPGMICGTFTCIGLVGEGAPCPGGYECNTPFMCREGVCRNASFCSL